MPKPVHIFIGGQELLGWTEMSLTRTKDNMTGELNIGIFMGYFPTEPVLVDAMHGNQILVYIGGHLAFIGAIDKRRGTGARHGKPGTGEADVENGNFSSQMSLNIGPNEYTVRLTARGMTKYLIDSSHQHPTTNMVKPTTKQVVEKLVEPWGVRVEWMGTEIELDRVRFRDGCRVVDELHRVCLENCYYMYETRDGKLRITDDTGRIEGEPIVLGVNVLSFSAEQSEDQAKSKIKVKGQRTSKEVWGKDAIIETVKEVEDQWVQSNIPVTVQHYGDATPEALERRAQFEANKRSAASKQISLDVFHVQSTSGAPWDIGQMHYVEIPPEGIFDVFECTQLTYTVQAEDELKTSLTLSPLPTSVSGGSVRPTGSLVEPFSEFIGIGRSRRATAGVTFAPGRYPQPWGGPNLLVLPLVALSSIASGSQSSGGILPTLTNLEDQSAQEPVLTLPAWYKSPGEI